MKLHNSTLILTLGLVSSVTLQGLIAAEGLQAASLESPVSTQMSQSDWFNTLGIGADYGPHYQSGDVRNDEFQSSVQGDFQQLKAAGFKTIRSYGDPAKVWIEMINQASENNLGIVYQFSLCQSDPVTHNCINIQGNPSFDSIKQFSQTQLQQVINIVGADKFASTVKLILAGNEDLISSGDVNQGNYITNVGDLVDGISALKTTLSSYTNLSNIPISASVQADVMIGTDSNGKLLPGRQELVDAFSTDAPVAVNLYPYQWGLNPDQAVTGGAANSVDWYIQKLQALYPERPILIAETGWATEGTDTGYAVSREGTPDDAASYYKQLYEYVTTQQYPLLGFEAFDQPTKSPIVSGDAEKHYGVFDDACALKTGFINNHPTDLLPNPSYTAQSQGCSDNQALFTFNGGLTNPPDLNSFLPKSFILTVTNSDGTSYTNTVNPFVQHNPSNISTLIWGTLNLSPGSQVKLSSSDGQKSCTNTVKTINISNHSGGTWQFSGSGLSGCEGVNWADGQNVFLPTNFGNVGEPPPQSVPEPSLIQSLALLGLAGSLQKAIAFSRIKS